MVSQDLSSVIVEDFNCIVRSFEKRVSRQFVDNIESIEFREFIDNAGMIDLGYYGSRFTWCNNRIEMVGVWKRIDRALGIVNWIQ